jgi:nucleoside-diphosphate-sugar epimerase
MMASILVRSNDKKSKLKPKPKPPSQPQSQSLLFRLRSRSPGVSVASFLLLTVVAVVCVVQIVSWNHALEQYLKVSIVTRTTTTDQDTTIKPTTTLTHTTTTTITPVLPVPLLLLEQRHDTDTDVTVSATVTIAAALTALELKQPQQLVSSSPQAPPQPPQQLQFLRGVSDGSQAQAQAQPRTSNTPSRPTDITTITEDRHRHRRVVLVTGAAGFVGMHLVRELLNPHAHVDSDNDNEADNEITDSTDSTDSDKYAQYYTIIGYDNLNEHENDATLEQPNNLKKDRLALLEKEFGQLGHESSLELDSRRPSPSPSSSSLPLFQFIQGDVCDRDLLNATIVQHHVTMIVHLAAAGDEEGAAGDDGDSATHIQRTSTSSMPSRPFHYPANHVDCIVDLLEILKHQRQSFIDQREREREHDNNNTIIQQGNHNLNSINHLKRIIDRNNRNSIMQTNTTTNTNNTTTPSPSSTSSSSQSPSPYYYAALEYEQGIDFLYVSTAHPDRYDSLVRKFNIEFEESTKSTNNNNTLSSISSMLDKRPRSNEMIAKAYHSLYNISSTAIRLPNQHIWGPWKQELKLEFEFHERLSHLLPDNAMHVTEVVHNMARIIRNKHKSKHSQSQSSQGYHQNQQPPKPLAHKKEETERFTIMSLDNVNTHKSDDNARFVLKQQMQQYLQWVDTQYNSTTGTKYIHQSRTTISSRNDRPAIALVNHTHTTASALGPLQSAAANNDRNDEICFVTSMFAATRNKADAIYNISHYDMLKKSSSTSEPQSKFRFFFFTNLPELAQDTGWEPVLMADLDQSFRRRITQSRWPKFMAWQHPQLNKCKVVLYADANLPPKDIADVAKWEPMITKALRAPSGIYQRVQANVLKKNRTITQELDNCVGQRKDLKVNIDASTKWLRQQPDFNNDAFGYWNMILVYDPNNLQTQELMTTFWAHYSAEDQSWRDQPLWRYLTDKLHIRPSTTKKHGYFNKFWHKKSGRNTKNHKYRSEDDRRAVAVVQVVQEVQDQDQRQPLKKMQAGPSVPVVVSNKNMSVSSSSATVSNTPTDHPLRVLPELLELQEQPTTSTATV